MAYSEYATISQAGRYVAFDSGATNLVSTSTNGATPVYVKDLQTGAVTLASSTASGVALNGGSFFGQATAEMIFSNGPTLEMDPADNSLGFGSFPNLLGVMELDGAFMDGTAAIVGLLQD